MTERGKIIICINPLIVIGTYTRKLQGWDDSSWSWFRVEPIEPNPETGAPQARVFLPHLFSSGLRLPWSEELQWFSPDMNVRPSPLSDLEIEPGLFRIPVYWGAVQLRREGDELIASALWGPSPSPWPSR
ncbi:MAG: hypothetical protein EA376_04150 [Phycisphaeraceae bacterium]|nr:MAG: hypothetical protein EA376_04150 [Phycisphaeraceae bacterium]